MVNKKIDDSKVIIEKLLDCLEYELGHIAEGKTSYPLKVIKKVESANRHILVADPDELLLEVVSLPIFSILDTLKNYSNISESEISIRVLDKSQLKCFIRENIFHNILHYMEQEGFITKNGGKYKITDKGFKWLIDIKR